MRVSIIVINYNYDRFLGEAIDSALAVRWPDKEVIVVDDGSTDRSREIIAGYGDAVLPILKQNGGQSDSANAAMRIATGEVIFFLDSDDALLPDAAEAVARVWHDGIAKVQFPMLVVSEQGRPTGDIYPNFPADYRIDVNDKAPPLIAPTSGNAWSRRFLERVFPLPLRYGDDKHVNGAFDGYLGCVARHGGEVVSLTTPHARYRINPNNAWSRRFSVEMVADNCDEDWARTVVVNETAQRLGHVGPAYVLSADYTHMMKRLVYRRFLAERYRYGESLPGVTLAGMRSVLRYKTLSTKTKLLLLGWFAAVAVLPKRWALPVIKMRFVTSYRPAIVNKLLAFSGWRGRSKTA